MNDLEIFTDGGARGNPGPAASAFVVIDKGNTIYQRSRYLSKRTNNEAEYEALIMALVWLNKNQKKFKEKNIKIFLDSELIVKQLTGLYKIKSQRLKPLAAYAKSLEKKFAGNIEIFFVRREKNFLADSLVNKELDEHPT